ncbi:MAG: ABC transporter permease [Spirochaetales bacterium]|nr:ABC transporter permease [Spirochaetales bacterium]
MIAKLDKFKSTPVVRFFRENNSIYILILVIIAACISASPKFTRPANIINLTQSIGTYGILAIGLTFIFLVGGIDLSLAYQVALDGTLFVLMCNSIGFFPALLITLVLGCCIGYMNGTIVTRLKIPSLIGTLAVMTSLKGLVLILNNDSSGRAVEATLFGERLSHFYNIKLFGFLTPSHIICIIFLVALGMFLKYKRDGINMYVVGGNPEAGLFSGINNDRLTRMAFTIGGFCASFCSILVVMRMNTSTYNMGDNLDIIAICSVVVGGVKMQGGKGNMAMCIMGVATIQIINNVMTKLGMRTAMQALITGIVVILVLILDKITSNIKANNA